jgi:hypothetical protein
MAALSRLIMVKGVGKTPDNKMDYMKYFIF